MPQGGEAMLKDLSEYYESKSNGWVLPDWLRHCLVTYLIRIRSAIPSLPRFTIFTISFHLMRSTTAESSNGGMMISLVSVVASFMARIVLPSWSWSCTSVWRQWPLEIAMSPLLPYLMSLIVLQISLNAFVVAFTSPSSLFRLAFLPVIVICVQQTLPICLEATGRVLWAALIGAHSISFLFQYIDTALLSKWTVEAAGPTKSRDGRRTQGYIPGSDEPNSSVYESTTWGRLRFGYYAAVSTRNVGSSFEVSGVPHFSTKDPSYVPSRGIFIRQKALLLLSCYLVLDTFTLLSQPDQNPLLYNESEISLANSKNRSVEKIVIRSASTVGFWVNLYCVIQFYMGSVALVSVALGLSEVNSWPPGFGSLSEAYTLRQFWG